MLIDGAGNVSVYNTPSSNNHVANKAYVDTTINSNLNTNLSGGSLTNNPTVTNNNDSANYRVVFTNGATGRANLLTDGNLFYNPDANILYAATFSGALSGNATSATSASQSSSNKFCIGVGVGDVPVDTMLLIRDQGWGHGPRIRMADWLGYNFSIGKQYANANCYVWNHNDGQLEFGTNNSQRMVITSDGRVGIGQPNPICPLDVRGNRKIGGGTSALWTNQYFFAGPSPTFFAGIGTYNPGSGDWNLDTSIFASDYIVSDSGYGIYSDRRIKTNIVDIIDGEALIQLRKLEPKQFTYFSSNLFKRVIDNKYGFIAQDVEKVIPYSVLKTKEIVPNFMVHVKLSIYTEQINKTENVLNGNVKYYYYLEYISLTPELFDINYKFIFTGNHDANGNEYKTNTQAPASDPSGNQIFKILLYNKKADTYEVFTKKIGDKKLIIYSDKVLDEDIYLLSGQEVDDFRVLDKDPITTITTAALQEVDRRQQADKARIAELENHVSILESTVANQQSLINDILERLKKVGA